MPGQECQLCGAGGREGACGHCALFPGNTAGGSGAVAWKGRSRRQPRRREPARGGPTRKPGLLPAWTDEQTEAHGGQ